MDEWLFYNDKGAIFQPYLGENKLNWWDDNDVRFVPDQHTVLSASSLKHQSACKHAALLRHIILIPSQAIFTLSPLWFVLHGKSIKTQKYHLPIFKTTQTRHQIDQITNYKCYNDLLDIISVRVPLTIKFFVKLLKFLW